LEHRDLGQVQRWQHRSGRARVDRYVAGSGRFLALVAEGEVWSLVSRHRLLTAAQRAAERGLREVQCA
jgi:hypothetical protein